MSQSLQTQPLQNGEGQPQQQRLVPPKQKNPVAIVVATYLRYHKLLKQRQGMNIITSEKQDFFRYKRIIRALLSDDYKKQQLKQPSLPPIETNQQAQSVFILLIQNQLVQPIKKLKTIEAKEKKIKLEKSVPCLEPTTKATLQPDEYYIWNFTPPNPYLILYSILGIVGIFTVILFPLWPFWMRKGVWYLSTGMLGLIGLFFVVAIIRLIIYLFTLMFLTRRFWLFPNLFEDCGFFDSFKPTYAWEDPSTTEKSKKKGKKSQKNITSTNTTTTEKQPVSKTTQSSTSTTEPSKRVATVEEIAE
ncbi:hypothetical protein CANARDRAFT_25961 [[Candida] arabinofermentans NRRL YB-2248]|uniref:Translocation protein SEC62 n=1 Tax=[Candida] arabinofermentans NRRL YB-2248 TaxID=983967 RepID=A0A1E4T7K3_9ASCO|nr:hypothetical protein CANARDRAFT_25961 [[Candida] arabinofermentans NRRL YB-2248]